VSSGPDLNIRRHKKQGVCIFDCSGRLTIDGGDAVLRAELLQALEEGERRLVFDMSALSYMDSAGVGEVVACSKRAFERSGVIKILLRPDGAVRRIFEITCLDRAFETFTDEGEAVASFFA
jgi:anti-anti-sigma factor